LKKSRIRGSHTWDRGGIMNFDRIRKKLGEGYYQAPLPADMEDGEKRFSYFSYMTSKLCLFKLDLKEALEKKCKGEISDAQFEVLWDLATGIIYDNEKMEKIISYIEDKAK